MITESFLKIELYLDNETKLICEIIFSMHEPDMLVIMFMDGK